MAHVPLTVAEVPGLLVKLGVAGDERAVRVERLTGGVSSAVFKADFDEQSVVIKQALPRLQVSSAWFSDPGRSSVEFAAAKYLSKRNPGCVPRVLARDPLRHFIVMEAVDRGAITWKEEMLAGRFDPVVSSRAGSLLGSIHEVSGSEPELRDEFATKRYFRELRVDAYVLEVGRVHPQIGWMSRAWAERLENGAMCLVHADFSPKNLMVTPARDLVLLDHEVAHWGDPSFDLTFFMTHLLAKSMRFDDARLALDASLAAYRAVAPRAWEHVQGAGELLGLMMLARVDGKSPLEYLDERERRRFRSAAMGFIHDPPSSLADLPAV